MVTFELIEKDDNCIVYNYWPENDRTKKPGKVIIDRIAEEVDLELAEADFWCSSSVEEQNSMRDSMNRMRIEAGKPELTEEEWPTATEEMQWTFYGSYAIRKIIKSYNAETILEHGMAAWY